MADAVLHAGETVTSASSPTTVTIHAGIDSRTVTQRNDDDLVTFDIKSDLRVRDAAKREIEARVVPWDTVITHTQGREMFVRGAFADTDPSDVVLRMDHQDPAAGIGIDLQDREDGAYMTFRVSQTQRGDEILQLAADRVTKGVSIGFAEVPGGTEFRTIDGRRTAVYTRARLGEVSTTWKPAYARAQVLAVREREDEVAEVTAEKTTEAAVDFRDLVKAFEERSTASAERILDHLEKMEERARTAIALPGPMTIEPKVPVFRDWLEAALKTRAGEPLNTRELEERDLADVLLSDQNVPATLRPEVVAFVNPRRPFLQSTTEVAAPESGNSITIPVMTQAPTADVQENEKEEVDSTALQIENATINSVTVAGAVDVSYQFIRRAPRTYFDLLRRALFAAYAARAEAEGVAALLNGIGVGSPPTTHQPTPGAQALDPEDLKLGDAFSNAMENALVPPDTIWLAPDAVAAFMDAKATTTNQPLYWQINSQIAAGGVSGNISLLRPVMVPALDGSGVDAIVGPSEQFAWAEDGTFELTADKPAILGRDIALASIMFFMPLAPEAFTTYSLAA